MCFLNFDNFLKHSNSQPQHKYSLAPQVVARSLLYFLSLQTPTFLAVDATGLDIWASETGSEWINTNPQQGEDRSEEDSQDDDNRRCAVLPAHKTLEEWV